MGKRFRLFHLSSGIYELTKFVWRAPLIPASFPAERAGERKGEGKGGRRKRDRDGKREGEEWDSREIK